MITGIRPTGDLTIANYLGAIKPIMESAPEGTAIFVADLHALTDNEPSFVAKYRFEVVKDYIALGISTDKFYIYLQSAIGYETALCATYLSRLISVAELLRVPTLKDKLKGNAAPETANVALLEYPVLMTADIFLQKAASVPIGEDQTAHLEVSRELARRFNKRYGKTFAEPKAFQVKTLRLLSLRGAGKMSKSNPDGAIFLTDSSDVVRQKMKRAQTANPGERTPELDNLILISELLTSNRKELHKRFSVLIFRHDAGEKVMGQFKDLLADMFVEFVVDFQDRRQKISDKQVRDILEVGASIARSKAQKVLATMESAMGFDR